METLKHRNFVSEPVGDKPVTELPGIGPSLGKVLKKAGYVKASKIVGKFLMLERDIEEFSEWLRQTHSARPEHAKACALGLKEYCDNHI